VGGQLDPSLHGIVVGSGGVLFFIVRNLPDGLSRVRFADNQFPDGQFPDGWHFGSDPHPSYPDVSRPVVESLYQWRDCTWGSRFGFSYVFFNAFHWSTSGVAFVTLPFWFVIIFPLILPAHWLVRTARRRRHRSLDDLRCNQCGYDLRASPLRCPECGSLRKSS
jgi:hypothetical protein